VRRRALDIGDATSPPGPAHPPTGSAISHATTAKPYSKCAISRAAVVTVTNADRLQRRENCRCPRLELNPGVPRPVLSVSCGTIEPEPCPRALSESPPATLPAGCVPLRRLLA
jgi:hypothetical protein